MISTKQIEKEIARQEKKHDAIMRAFYKTTSNELPWGDSLLYEQADKLSRRIQMLRDAIALINKYQEGAQDAPSRLIAGPTTTREHRRQVRLDKTARRYANKVRQGKNIVRYV